MQSKVLLVAAAATGAFAITDLSGTFPQKFRRALAVEARDESACVSVVAAHSTLTEDFPTLPTQLATETALDVPQITDPCQFPSITGSAGVAITSYSSALQSWQDAHITEIRALYSACSDVPAISAVLEQYGNAVCSTALAVLTSQGTNNGTGSATATATATTTVSGSATVTATGEASGEASASGAASETTAVPAAAAPRETGLFVAAAAAAAGLVGAVML